VGYIPSIDSSKMIGNSLEISNVNRFFLPTQPVISSVNYQLPDLPYHCSQPPLQFTPKGFSPTECNNLTSFENVCGATILPKLPVHGTRSRCLVISTSPSCNCNCVEREQTNKRRNKHTNTHTRRYRSVYHKYYLR
jgi:hypothetical protein